MEAKFNKRPDEARKLWTDALRSGRFKQGLRRLCNASDGTYCCLGVACEVFREHEVGLAKDVVVDSLTAVAVKFARYVDRGRMSSHDLPTIVCQWLGVVNSHGMMRDGETLIGMNDRLRYSFSQIADAIDKDLPYHCVGYR